ncbi:hypothetical protein Tco_1133693 [Tanacetum coccineum]
MIQMASYLSPDAVRNIQTASPEPGLKSSSIFIPVNYLVQLEYEYMVMNPTSLIQRISLTGFPAQSVGSSNTDVLDSPCLLVLITGTSQSRQHESCKSPTAELFEVDSGRISIRHCEY